MIFSILINDHAESDLADSSPVFIFDMLGKIGMTGSGGGTKSGIGVFYVAGIQQKSGSLDRVVDGRIANIVVVQADAVSVVREPIREIVHIVEFGYQLAGENANEKNLITGTRYLNVVGMLPFENMVADYVNETDNHVLYRVTPVFEGDNLVASGVRIEAESVEDKGAGIRFHVYCYNVQPGITIDYATGDSWLTEDSEDDDKTEVQSNVPSGQQNVITDKDDSSVMVHVTDTGTKYHSAGCSYLSKSDHEITLEEAKEQGLKPCSKCNPPQ